MRRALDLPRTPETDLDEALAVRRHDRHRGIDNPFDLDPGQLRSGLLDRLFDGQLHGHHRRLATVAAPFQAEADDTVRDAEHGDAAAVRGEEWPHPVECAGDPHLGVFRMETMKKKETGDEIIGGEAGEQRTAGGALVDDLHHPFEAAAIELEEQAHQLLGRLAGARIGDRPQLGEHRFDAVTDRAHGDGFRHVSPLSGDYLAMIGECRCSRILPLPRYMWTPHGRHGSKLRTVRMMSMPLNLSWLFSSKIGQPYTASS